MSFKWNRQHGARRRRWLVFALLPVMLVASLAMPAMGEIPESPELWVSRYVGPGRWDVTRSFVVSPDGTKVFVTGWSDEYNPNYDAYATVAYDAANGRALWVARYNATGNSSAESIAVSPDGSKVFVTGFSRNVLGGSTDFATVAYDADNGTELWVARYNEMSGGQHGASAVAVSADSSKIFVTGWSSNLGDSTDYATVAYSATNGNKLWVARYDGPTNARDHPTAMSVSPDGSRVFVTGYSADASCYSSNGCADYATVAYSATSGQELWVARYGDSKNEGGPTSISISPDSSKVFVTGSLYDLTCRRTNCYDTATAAYDAGAGTELWVARYNGLANSGDYAESLAVSPDGSKVFVTGYSWGLASSYDYLTFAYDAESGEQIWIARYNRFGESYDRASSVAVSPDGSKVFVTGTSSDDFGTVAYGAENGRQLWFARYNGLYSGSSDYARAVAVSPDGSRVFVTGSSGPDYTTISYRATACANGRDEDGPISNPVQTLVPPVTQTATPYLHGVNCDIVAANGL